MIVAQLVRSVRRLALAVVLETLLLPIAWAAPPSGRIEVTINGMVCSFCAQGIERNLRRLPGVEGVSVDLGQHRVAITLRPGSAVEDGQIRKAIRDSGFDVREISHGARTP